MKLRFVQNMQLEPQLCSISKENICGKAYYSLVHLSLAKRVLEMSLSIGTNLLCKWVKWVKIDVYC